METPSSTVALKDYSNTIDNQILDEDLSAFVVNQELIKPKDNKYASNKDKNQYLTFQTPLDGVDRLEIHFSYDGSIGRTT